MIKTTISQFANSIGFKKNEYIPKEGASFSLFKIEILSGLTVALAAELAPKIRLNCIAPSLTKSKIANSIIKNSSIEESIAKLHPLKRIGEGTDSANLAYFLLTSKSSWITGQIIAVDGGRSNIA